MTSVSSCCRSEGRGANARVRYVERRGSISSERAEGWCIRLSGGGWGERAVGQAFQQGGEEGLTVRREGEEG